MRWVLLTLVVVALAGCVPGDANRDGCVNYLDLALLATAYGARCGDARYGVRVDFNLDGVVDGQDLAIMNAHYREGCR